MTFSRRLCLLAPLLLLVLFTGCVDTEDNAGVFRATYSWWVGALAKGGGLFGIFVGWMWKQSDFRGWLILIIALVATITYFCLLYTSPSPRDATLSRMPSSA